MHQTTTTTQQQQQQQHDLSNALANFSLQGAHPSDNTSSHTHPNPQLPLPSISRTPESQRKRARIADFVAHNTCAMVCYLSFGDLRSSASQTTTHSPPPTTDMERARLQFVPSTSFVEFMHGLLTTTQVSQSVIVLSLHYIYRLKLLNPRIQLQEGSELRLAVSALMLANKFLDELVSLIMFTPVTLLIISPPSTRVSQ